jgi:hypothetical protein
MNLMLPIRTKKAFPEDEVVYIGRYTDEEGDNAYKQVLEIEKRIGKSGQGILELVHELRSGTSTHFPSILRKSCLPPRSSLSRSKPKVTANCKPTWRTASYCRRHGFSRAAFGSSSRSRIRATAKSSWPALLTMSTRHGRGAYSRRWKSLQRSHSARSMVISSGRPCHK